MTPLGVEDGAADLVHEGVRGVDTAAGELSSRPGHLDGVVTEPGVAAAGPGDRLLESAARRGRWLVDLDSQPSFGDEQVGNAARPVTGAHGADRDRIRQRVVLEE